MVADELRRQADEFIDLTSLMPRIGRDPGERVRSSEARRASHPGYGAPSYVSANTTAPSGAVVDDGRE
jgi:hypothetical protein